MHNEVFVTLSPGEEQRLDLHGSTPMELEQARRWLDDEFIRLECEPLRASGKVLLADKVLVIAQAAGARHFGDAAWAAQFGQAAVAALARPTLRIDVPAMAVTY